MRTDLLISICLFVAVVQAHAQVTPPMGSEILLDGKCSDDEWLDAKTIASNQGHSIRMKRSERYLYLCITYPEDAGGTFEGYLVTDAQRTPLNIHVSAKIGEREWQGEDWPEWDWWNAQGWWSTPVRYNSFEAGERRFLRTPAREIQFDLNHFGRSGWRLMFDVYYGRNDDGTYRTVPLPAGATFADESTWFEFRL
ncbi:MAG: hypothetical protein AAFO81_14010 [Pseudomonadota bacterium]